MCDDVMCALNWPTDLMSIQYNIVIVVIVMTEECGVGFIYIDKLVKAPAPANFRAVLGVCLI